MTGAKRSSNKKMANGLVGLSSAAVFAVYSVGFFRTRAAADRVAAASQPWPTTPGQTSAAGPGAAPWEPNDFSGRGQARGTGPAAVAPLERFVANAEAPPASSNVPAPAMTKVDAGTAAATSAAVPTPTGVSSASTPTSVPAADTSAKAPEPAAAAATAAAPAPAATAAAQPESKPDPPKLKDGTYSGWGTCRHGDIEATVVVEEGKIKTAGISQCLTRYSCSWIAMLPGQVVTRQSPNVDFVSGATDSTYAFYYAVISALANAK